jgi:serine/threonine protein kinase
MELQNIWKVQAQDLKLLSSEGTPIVLGQGAFGKVYKGRLYDVSDVAVKVVTSQNVKEQRRFLREIATLKAIRDENIVSFLGANIQSNKTFLVMEYMHRGDLWNMISEDSTNYGWYKRGARIALDVAAGLVYLHRHGIVHLDVKTPNILLNNEHKAKISDVGLGKYMVGPDVVASHGGSFLWAAPEQLQGIACTEAADMFSFGTVLWEICSGDRPYKRTTRPLKFPEECPESIANLVTHCHLPEPSLRVTAAEAYRIIKLAL